MQITDDDFVHDPQLQAVDLMSYSDKQAYKKIGKELFGHSNFSGAKLINNLKSDKHDNIAFVTKQLDDGIHPSYLEEGECKILENQYGPTWYLKWGYVEGDLTSIVTVDRTTATTI